MHSIYNPIVTLRNVHAGRNNAYPAFNTGLHTLIARKLLLFTLAFF